MIEKKLKQLISLLEQYRHDYILDSMMEYVHIAYLLKDIENKSD